MSQVEYNVKIRKNKHLTEREHYEIEVLLKEGVKPVGIAKLFGRHQHQRTIEREIAKGNVRLLNSDLTYKQSFCFYAAKRIYHGHAKNKGPGLKISNDHKLVQHIENKIVKEKYSPGVVIGEIRAKELLFETSICTKTLYNYIDQELFLNLTNKDLPVKKNKKRRDYK